MIDLNAISRAEISIAIHEMLDLDESILKGIVGESEYPFYKFTLSLFFSGYDVSNPTNILKWLESSFINISKIYNLNVNNNILNTYKYYCLLLLYDRIDVDYQNEILSDAFKIYTSNNFEISTINWYVSQLLGLRLLGIMSRNMYKYDLIVLLLSKIKPTLEDLKLFDSLLP